MGHRFAMAMLRACAVLAAAIACALLLPTRYETTALVHSDQNLPWSASELPEIGIDGQVLQRLALERARDITPEAIAEAAGALLSATRLEKIGPRSVAISLRDVEPTRAQRHCNALAEGLIERSVSWARAEQTDKARAERERAALELANFAAKHSQLWEAQKPEPLAAEAVRARIRALTAERAAIQRRLAEGPPEPTDNPYGAPTGLTPAARNQFIRRSAEIDVLLANERRSPVLAEPSAEDRESSVRLGQLLDRVRTSPFEAPEDAPQLSIARAAPLPSWSLLSTRSFTILAGGLLAIGVFLFPELHFQARLRRAREEGRRGQARRTTSQRPSASGAPASKRASASRQLSARTAPAPKEDPASKREAASASHRAPPQASAEEVPAASQGAAAAAATPLPLPYEAEVARPAAPGPDEAPVASPPVDDLSLVMAYPVQRWSPPEKTERCRNICREFLMLAQEASLIVTVSGTSTLAESRARVAVEIALILAETPDARVLLVDADFERSPDRSLVNASPLVAKPLSEQIRSRLAGGTERQWFVTACTPTFHALLDGTAAEAHLIASTPFRNCILELQEYYDFVVVVGPSLENPSLCRSADAVSDAIVVVHGEHQSLDPRSWPFSKRLWLLSVRA